MRKLNPILLDVLYRAGAYPFDEVDLGDGSARPSSVWVLPKCPLPVFLAIRGNGTSTAALIAELHRLHRSFQVHHGKVPEGALWGYMIVAHCENTHSRIVSREMREFEPEEIAVGLNAYAFIPWFDPPKEAEAAYSAGEFTVELLPPSELEQDDEGLYTSRDWEDAVNAPDALEASFARSLGLDSLADVGASDDDDDDGSFDAPDFDDDDDDEDFSVDDEDGDENEDGDEDEE